MTSTQDRVAAIHPISFAPGLRGAGAAIYLSEEPIRMVAEFFVDKGLAALKAEDHARHWYDDWIAYQARHRLYAQVLSPRQFSSTGGQFDLLRITRMLEVFGYFSPSHGYSLQVTFLGVFPIFMSNNTGLKQEAVAVLEAGGLLAFGVSEKEHGADLLANEFSLKPAGPGQFVANGKKFYIGNVNCASIISILAKTVAGDSPARATRSLPAMFALRPAKSPGYGNVKKIDTLGVRAAFVGEFEVVNHPVPETDTIAQGRGAWDASFGTVTLGKFFLGFGAIGICEHALEETAAHLTKRILYGKPAVQMPHLRLILSLAYARLAAMKFYAYRALDYVQAANANDRRYLLFNAVQKARVSTQGVKVISLLSECMGAKGFETDTYFEMALRDVQLIPGLEGSTHINLSLAAQFIPQYFAGSVMASERNLAAPPSLAGGEVEPSENPYLFEARSGSINSILFPKFLNAFRPLMSIPNVQHFARQAKAFSLLVRHSDLRYDRVTDSQIVLAMGQCVATIAYGQLVCENAVRLGIDERLISVMLGALVQDFNVYALELASIAPEKSATKISLSRLVKVPRMRDADWDFVAERVGAFGGSGAQ